MDRLLKALTKKGYVNINEKYVDMVDRSSGIYLIKKPGIKPRYIVVTNTELTDKQSKTGFVSISDCDFQPHLQKFIQESDIIIIHVDLEYSYLDTPSTINKFIVAFDSISRGIDPSELESFFSETGFAVSYF